MFHLDNNSGIDVMPPQKQTISRQQKWFTEGDTQTPPSYPGADWFNIVQAELLNVLKDGGITPSKSELSQLSAAIKNIINKNHIEINDASLMTKGVVKLSSATNSSSETDAATPAAIKKINDEVIITKNIAASAQNTADASVRRNGDNMTGELQINGIRVLVEGDALPVVKSTNSTNNYEVDDRVEFRKRPTFNGEELITKKDYTYKTNEETVVIRRADGLIIQRFVAQSYAGHGSNGTVVTLPVAFPNEFYIAVANDGAGGCHAVTAVPASLSTVKIYGKNRGDYTDSLLQITVVGR